MMQQEEQLNLSQTSTQNSPKQSRQSFINNLRGSIKQLPILNKNQIMRDRYQQMQQIFSESCIEQQNCQKSQTRQKEIISFDVFEEKYKILEKFGEGTNGLVYRCIKKKTGEIFVVKKFTVEEEQLSQLFSNFKLISSFNHPNIVKHHSLYVDLSKCLGWLVMDFAEGITLEETVLSEEDDLKIVIFQLLKILAYFQEKKLVHRDIKPENIIYNPKTKQIKLVDFGIARELKKGSQLWTNTGTLFYKAPEMFEGAYTESIDVWATGILLYYLVCKKTPFQSEYQKEVIKNIKNIRFEFPSQFQNYSQEIKSFIEFILTKNVKERPNPQKCLENAWLSSFIESFQDYFPLENFSNRLIPHKKEKKRQYSKTQKTKLTRFHELPSRISEIYIEDSDWSQDF